jgi:AraC-like DNA-binding protein
VLPEAHVDPSDIPLLPRIGFDPALEIEGFRRLAELDLEGSRAAFRRLAERLQLEDLGERGREAVLLLLDVLQKVEARLHPEPPDRDAYLAARAALLAEFAGLQDPAAARAVFLQRLNRRLACLGRPPVGGRPLVERAKALIEERYRERLSLSAVASRLHVSPNHLSRTFRQQTGNTLTAFVHRTRLTHARRLLAEGERTICEIAYSVGYQNYRDFYRNFIKHENASPREVRRRGTGV